MSMNCTAQQLLEEFVTERHALGFNTKDYERCIKRFLSDFKNPVDENIKFTKDYVLGQIRRKPNQGNNTVLKNISAINCFLNFVTRKGFQAYIIPAKTLPKEKKIFKAKIFTDDEIEKLLIAADSFQFSMQNPNKIYHIPLMLRILINCGLRTAELLNLKMCDVDLDENIFTVRDTKFKKDRYVPFSDAVADALKLYLSKVELQNETNWLFQNPKTGERYGENIFNTYFRDILRKAGIPHGGRGNGPRPHDLRHSFAVHCLNKWAVSGVDLMAALPVLSRYLGHSGIDGTQKYLQLTAEMYPEIINRLETNFGTVIPCLEVQNEAG